MLHAGRTKARTGEIRRYGARRRAAGPVLLVLAGVLLAACNQEEDRVLIHEPGVYQGQPDQPLDAATRERLRERALRQAEG
jgi:hypothetical protein